MSNFSKWWNRRPARGSAPLGRRFRAALETLEDRVTPALTPIDVSVAIVGSDTATESPAQLGSTITGYSPYDVPKGPVLTPFFQFVGEKPGSQAPFFPLYRPLEFVAPPKPTDFSLEVSSIIVAENATEGTIVRFTRHDGSTAAASDSVEICYNTVEIGVDFTLTGADSYATNKLSFSFAAGETTHDVIITPIDNTIMEETKGLVFVDPRGKFNPTLYFEDDDRTPLYRELIGPNPVSEEGTDVLTIRYTRSGDTSAPLTVPFSLGGGYSAAPSRDLTFIGADSFSADRPTQIAGFFTFAAGESVHDLVIVPTDDTFPEGVVSYTVGIYPLLLDTHFQIADADVPRIAMSLSSNSVTEDGDPIVVTLKRSGNLAIGSNVRFQLTGLARRNSDYTVTGASFYDGPGPTEFYGHESRPGAIVHYGEVYFPAGSDVATFVIDPTADTTDEPDESIVISLDISWGQQYSTDVVSLSATIVGNPNLPQPPSYLDESGNLVIRTTAITLPDDPGNNPQPPPPVVPSPLPPQPSPGVINTMPFPTTSITSPPAASPPAVRPGEKAIESLYVNLLGRPGESTGKESWLSLYTAGTPMKTIVLGFERSQEYAEKFVREKYQQVLSRAPEAEGLAFWSAKIMAGESSDAVTRDMMLSPEYALGLKSNADFVKKAYRTLLGREADPSAAGWIQGLDKGGSRAAFVQGVLDSREARDRRTRSAYETYLHRGASDAELSGWYEFAIGAGATPAKFLAEFLNGDEFLSGASAG